MTTPTQGPTSEISQKILVALDVDSAEKARELVDQLKGRVGGFKIGLQLFSNSGPALVREFAAEGLKVFLDLKFHDIPNTVARAAEQVVSMGVWMFNVHAAGGKEMMSRTADAVADRAAVIGCEPPLLIGVTVLTSSDQQVLASTGVLGEVSVQVERLAMLASASGLNGVVASAREVPLIKAAVSDQNFLTVTPGIRSSSGTLEDQKRVTTVGDAIAAGSDFLVIGRPITGAQDPAAALEQIISE
jgi:orotidine-5'-phosphate decarboxylase